MKIKLRLEKKAQATLLKTAAIALVVIAITISMGARVLDQVNDTLSTTDQYQIIANGTKGLSDLSIWLPIIAIVIAAVVIIGLLGLMGGAGAGRR